MSYRDFQMLSQRHPTARVEHICSQCDKIIPAGSVYVKLAYLSEGQFWAEKLHVSPCYDAR